MRERRIKDLVQLSDTDFIRTTSEGLSLIVENAGQLATAAKSLKDAKHPQGTEILKLMAGEEAAKFLILMDAVRCPLKETKLRSRTLGYYYNHLARGIYADLASAPSSASGCCAPVARRP